MTAPRWRLTNKHYIHIVLDGVESAWEYSEQSRQTGRMIRKKFLTPHFLNPENEADHNYPELQMIVVCQGKPDPGYERDFQFYAVKKDGSIVDGEPTPDMEPLNPEAEAITNKLRGKWEHPIESLQGNFGDAVLRTFEEQLQDVMNKAVNQRGQPTSVSPDILGQMKAMQEQIDKLAAKNLELQAGAEPPVEQFEPLEELPVESPPPVIKAPLRQAARR